MKLANPITLEHPIDNFSGPEQEQKNHIAQRDLVNPYQKNIHQKQNNDFKFNGSNTTGPQNVSYPSLFPANPCKSTIYSTDIPQKYLDFCGEPSTKTISK